MSQKINESVGSLTQNVKPFVSPKDGILTFVALAVYLLPL